MKNHIKMFATLGLCLWFAPAYSQPMMGHPGMSGGPQGPQLGGAMAKLFGDHPEFTADLDMQMKMAGDRTMNMPGHIAFDHGKSRFEMDMADMQGMHSPDAAARMKAMGMDKVVMISRPQDKVSYAIYPGMQAYTESPIQNPEVTNSESDFKMETTELGKETVDGHPCVKNKVVVTDQQGNKHESTVWNATDLKNFPVKIETTENGHASTMTFKNIKFSAPEASQFEPPSDYKKYDSMMAMMREQMMKHMGGMGMPPGQ